MSQRPIPLAQMVHACRWVLGPAARDVRPVVGTWYLDTYLARNRYRPDAIRRQSPVQLSTVPSVDLSSIPFFLLQWT